MLHCIVVPCKTTEAFKLVICSFALYRMVLNGFLKFTGSLPLVVVLQPRVLEVCECAEPPVTWWAQGLPAVHHRLLLAAPWWAGQLAPTPDCCAQGGWERLQLPVRQHLRALPQTAWILFRGDPQAPSASSYLWERLPSELGSAWGRSCQPELGCGELWALDTVSVASSMELRPWPSGDLWWAGFVICIVSYCLAWTWSLCRVFTCDWRLLLFQITLAWLYR